MLAALSPYHLTTRESPAMAALLLARQSFTVLPSARAGETETEARDAALSVSRFARFMESWRWTSPLWESGVLASGIGADEPVVDVRHSQARLERDERFAPLRPFMHADLMDDPRAYLNLVAKDILKGGPDPGINVPVAAGLDRFSIRRGLIVFRAHPSSIAQREEARLGARVFAIAIPVFLQADAPRILHAREVLEEPLSELRAAMSCVAAHAVEHGEAPAEVLHELELAARTYTIAFHEARESLLEPCDADEARIVDGTVTLTALLLPGDAVIRSSLAALRELAGPRRRLAPTTPVAFRPAATTLPTPFDPAETGRFLTLLVKPLGARK